MAGLYHPKSSRRPAAGVRDERRHYAASEQPTLVPGAPQLLDLQRRVGNQAVVQLLRQSGGDPPALAGASGSVQRAPSHGDPKLAVNDGQGVITAVAAGGGMAHTIIYIEKSDEAWKLDLTAGGLGSSGAESERQSTLRSGVVAGVSSGASGTATVSGTGLTINVEKASAGDLVQLGSTSTKRSWQVSNGQLDAALQTARDMAANVDQYVYKLAGSGLTWSRKKATNCARFGEEILKAAGVSASSGLIFKTPVELATGKKRFFKPKSRKSAAKAGAAVPEPRPLEPMPVPDRYDL